jgi:PKD repeat protein/erythromycin esterase-like protein
MLFFNRLRMQGSLLLMLMLLISVNQVFSQNFNQVNNCPNADLTFGNFTNWVGTTGTCCPIILTTTGIVAGTHDIVTPGFDPVIVTNQLNRVPQGYNFSAQLGNIAVSWNGSQNTSPPSFAEGLSYTYNVSQATALFEYNFAVVLQDPGHIPSEQPKFELEVLDQNNNPIPCTYYEVAAANNVPGFQTLSGGWHNVPGVGWRNNNRGTIRWRNWTKVGIDLLPYLGQNVTINARTGDCHLKGHFGYGYLVASCKPREITVAFCPGDQNATLTAPDGFSSYEWREFGNPTVLSTNQILTVTNPAQSAVYEVTVNSVMGCSATLTAVVDPVIIVPQFSIQESCNNTVTFNDNSFAQNGTIGLWEWDFGNGALYNQPSPTHTFSGPGNYSIFLRLTSTGGCKDSVQINIDVDTEPDPGFIISQACGLDIGLVDTSVTHPSQGGITQWNWNFGDGNSSAVQNPNHSYAGPGTYNVSLTVTNALGCSQTASQAVTPTPFPDALFSANEVCEGGITSFTDQSTIAISTLNSWQWNFGDGSTDTIQNPQHIYSTNGSYPVTLIVGTDANCYDTIVQNVTVNTNPIIISNPTQVDCFGSLNGSVITSIQNGTPGYTYQWNTGATSQDLTGVGPGNYELIVTDSKGCTDTLIEIIVQPPAPLALSSVVGNIDCFGSATGSVTLSVSGGTAPYAYSWDNGAVTQNLNNVVAGTYTVLVTDTNGCTESLTATITQPAAGMTSSAVATDVNCFGDATGAIATTISGGTAPYSFAWSNSATTQDIANLIAGPYTLITTDQEGCTDTLNVQINQPAAPVALALPSDSVLCFGQTNGALNLNVSGGTAPYSFLWNNGATTQTAGNLAVGSYSVVVTDDAGCKDSIQAVITGPPAPLALSSSEVNVDCFGNATGSITLSVNGGTAPYAYSWDNGAVTQNLNNVVAGTYTVLVTDTNGCTESLTATITQPAAGMTSSAVATDVNCFGDATGAIATTISGGTAPYSFAWSNSATTQDIANLIAGPYTLITTDQEGCTDTLNVQINQPAAPVALALPSDSVLCFGQTNGALNLNVSGGTAPYSFLWNNGATTQNINNLAVGTYSVLVTDDAGCQDSIQAVITGPPAPLALSSSEVNVDCFGNATGSITLSVNGGTAPYAYSWDNGAITQNLNNVVAGTYTVLVTDTNGCTESLTATITQPAAGMTSSAVATDVNCFGDATGAIATTISGGTAPYSFAWSNSATTQDIANLIAGPYTLITTDQEGCTDTLNVQINQPAAPVALALPSDSVLCFRTNEWRAESECLRWNRTVQLPLEQWRDYTECQQSGGGYLFCSGNRRCRLSGLHSGRHYRAAGSARPQQQRSECGLFRKRNRFYHIECKWRNSALCLFLG